MKKETKGFTIKDAEELDMLDGFSDIAETVAEDLMEQRNQHVERELESLLKKHNLRSHELAEKGYKVDISVKYIDMGEVITLQLLKIVDETQLKVTFNINNIKVE